MKTFFYYEHDKLIFQNRAVDQLWILRTVLYFSNHICFDSEAEVLKDFKIKTETDRTIADTMSKSTGGHSEIICHPQTTGLIASTMQTTNFLTLPDQRKLAYAEYGDPNGHPVMYFHGGVSCRLEPLLWGDETIRRLGLRLIAPDRPGVGQSDFQPNRGFSDCVKDIEFLSDALGLDKFSTLGISGGGGYPLACAALIPERLYAAVIVSGAWHLDAIEHFPRASRFAWMLIQKFPWLNLFILKLQKQSDKKSPQQLAAKLKKQLPPVDYAVLKSPAQIKIWRQISIESMRQGVKGTAWDVQLYLHSWDFSLDGIQMPLKFFHGEKDTNIPISLAKQVVMELPTAQLATYPEEGHISLIVNQFETIALSLVNDI